MGLQGYESQMNDVNTYPGIDNTLTISLDGLDSALKSYATLLVNGGISAISTSDILRSTHISINHNHVEQMADGFDLFPNIYIALQAGI